MKSYKRSEVLVTTQWVAEHQHDPNIRLVEVNEDILLYDTGHIPGAIKIDWQNDLQDSVIRDYIRPEQFEKLMSRKGISPAHQVIFYGDKNNWWACYAFWAFQLYGHPHCSIMDGGRQKWIKEGRPLNKEIPRYPETSYKVKQFNEKAIRAFREDVILHVKAKKPLIDVRSPQEFSGELLHMESYPQEGALRGGHIPQAINVPWSQAVKDDGTFKSQDELRTITRKTRIYPPPKK